MAIKDLSKAKCTLLTVHYATQANIPALHSFTPLRPDVLDPELILRILLTYLPEVLEPKKYVTYISEVTSRLYLDHEREDIEVDLSPVQDLDESTAERKVKKLDLLVIKPAKFPPHAPDDLLTRFVCHRAYRIDEATGALNHVQELIQPFLQRNDFIRIWYISVVLPILRLNYEYYPSSEHNITLEEFEAMEGREGVDFLLRKVTHEDKQQDANASHISQDIKGLIGPWTYGHTERSRRNEQDEDGVEQVDLITQRVRKIGLTGVSPGDRTGHDWEYVYKWIVQHAQERFISVSSLVEEWYGPSDIDIAGLGEGKRPYLDWDIQQKLDAQYAQVAFASCYAAKAEDQATIRGAHNILARLAELLDFIPPPDLATSVDSLPNLEKHAIMLDKSQTLKDLESTALLRPEHPLTTPRMETYMLLQMMVYSAYQLLNLGFPVSIVKVAELHFYSTAEELLQLLRRILQFLIKSGRRDDTRWSADRAKLIWLWNWGIKPEEVESKHGAGVLGKIPKEDFEKEMLQAFVDASCYNLAGDMLSLANIDSVLSHEQVELVIYNKAMEAYDGASNGNKTRGGIKKAGDILAAFKQHFPNSKKFAEASSLISATHSISFYSLTLQHGVPFQPVNIRVAKDPIELINKVLEQNPKSYTKLDDLTAIADNLVSAGLVKQIPDDEDEDREAKLFTATDEELRAVRRYAERRVTFMAVEAALREDDFETAYSYVVNRLTPSELMDGPPSQPIHTRNVSKSSTLSKSNTVKDDMSWRAAYLAGRFRPTTTSPITLRRLEQRTELLSLALLLAPTSALTDILSAWRRCEEESSALQQAENQDEKDFDDHADRRQASALPGHFTLSGEQPEMILNQKRREMGRMAASHTESETPMSMFDLTRSAARAFSKNVNLGQSRQPSEALSERSEATEGDESRVRRRDLVANAVSGSLASGIGWVLGAKPVDQQ